MYSMFTVALLSEHRFLRKRIQGIYSTEIFTQIYYKKLAHIIAKAGKSQEQQSGKLGDPEDPGEMIT